MVECPGVWLYGNKEICLNGGLARFSYDLSLCCKVVSSCRQRSGNPGKWIVGKLGFWQTWIRRCRDFRWDSIGGNAVGVSQFVLVFSLKLHPQNSGKMVGCPDAWLYGYLFNGGRVGFHCAPRRFLFVSAVIREGG